MARTECPCRTPAAQGVRRRAAARHAQTGPPENATKRCDFHSVGQGLALRQRRALSLLPPTAHAHAAPSTTHVHAHARARPRGGAQSAAARRGRARGRAAATRRRSCRRRCAAARAKSRPRRARRGRRRAWRDGQEQAAEALVARPEAGGAVAESRKRGGGLAVAGWHRV